ncbi:hypothetical protein L227DRAFT_507826 [Lentinus tigrinus ALCF2SS1-6]|uniref:F-box domain-containing protein n=1 Tax=Lentinus tigrinus ALCF2SS1-6 TaxID=1328759 RepID=A0A5C2S0E7_9APHY|nr:hypothetical protein L227DRAFT_507826 [Lentinus tigrinus ALCF2SS1-6]
MPTGLGRRASELGEREDFEEYVMNGRPSERKRSISLPAAATQAARWRAANLAEAEAEEEAKRPALERISPELLSSVFSYASRADVLSLAQVSKSFSLPALKALYADLDLRTDDDERIEQCIASLASRRPVASYVRSFACRALPPPEGGTMSLSTVTFAIALTNMDQLQSLTLPHFDLRILCHTTFPLRHLTLLCKNITPEDFHALFTWLGRHPSLVSLSLPSLVLPSLPPSVHPLTPVDSSGVPSRPHTPRTPDTPSHDSDAPSHVSSSPFPPTVVPSLRRFDGPVSIAAALVPGRPVERVQLPIQHTLYDGLRPSALMSALATARDTLRTLVIKPASTKIDQRTLERVVMSAGAELGDFIETLEVHWVLDDEILYKLIVGVLARFRNLHTLCMLRDSPPPHPTSPLLEFPLPPASPPLSAATAAANRRTSVSSYSSAFLSVRGVGSGPPSARSSTGTGTGSDTPFPRVHERAHLALWSKTCPALRNVLFLSGAEWGIYPNPTAGGQPQFEFVGYAAQ